MSKRVLITGAAGFLGSHLCDRFIKEGYQVVGMDNLITGSLRNIEHLFKLPEFAQFKKLHERGCSWRTLKLIFGCFFWAVGVLILLHHLVLE